MIYFNEMLTFLKKIFSCKHSNKKTIYIQNRYYDMMIDNDDLEDIPTYIKITYCTKCGKILEKHHIDISKKSLIISYTGGWIDSYPESDYSDILEFEKITGLNHKNITYFNKI